MLIAPGGSTTDLLGKEISGMHHRSWSRWVCAVITLAATGCTALRDIPRDQFGARPERKNVHIETRDGLVYEFDYVRLQGDSLVGFRRRDVEASVDEFATVPMPLEDVTHMSARGVDSSTSPPSRFTRTLTSRTNTRCCLAEPAWGTATDQY